MSINYSIAMLGNPIDEDAPKKVSTQFRAYPFERALFSALNRVLLKN